jgi:hypothetical protein
MHGLTRLYVCKVLCGPLPIYKDNLGFACHWPVITALGRPHPSEVTGYAPTQSLFQHLGNMRWSRQCRETLDNRESHPGHLRGLLLKQCTYEPERCQGEGWCLDSNSFFQAQRQERTPDMAPLSWCKTPVLAVTKPSTHQLLGSHVATCTGDKAKSVREKHFFSCKLLSFLKLWKKILAFTFRN